MDGKRNSKSSWIKAGTEALISDGVGALRAEPLAKSIGTTKGSFYWHFADVPSFQEAVVASWHSAALGKIVSQLSTSGSSEQRLRIFGAHVLADTVDPAIRAWAKSDKTPVNAIQQVDEQRLIYISTLLTSLNVANPAFALACYSTLIGAHSITSDKTPDDAFTALVDLVLALN